MVGVTKLKFLLVFGAPITLGALAACVSERSDLPDAGANGARDQASGRCAALALSESECGRLGDARLPSALPPARGNLYADNPAAARLGFELFFDLDAVSGRSVRCASCHAPEHGFASRFPMPTGLDVVDRNALPLVNAARMYPNFWDGRADSLWSQSLLTMENDIEMGGNRLAIVRNVATRYRTLYEEAFGPLPPLTETARFPLKGRPGTPEWSRMAPADQVAVTRAYVNVGKSFEAYLRMVSRGPSPVDRFLAGEDDALSPRAKAGFRSFVRYGCRSCHSGSTFSDGRFHKLDIPLPEGSPYREKSAGDRGRAAGVAALLASEFNALSPYYDRGPNEAPRLEEDTASAEVGAFRTPSLRNVGDTAPYGHNGVFPTLQEIVRFHLNGGGPSCGELPRIPASDAEVLDVVEFLAALRGTSAPLPWSDWPGASPVDAGPYDAR